MSDVRIRKLLHPIVISITALSAGISLIFDWGLLQ